MQYDVIIIGQGLAGSLLAWELMRREQQVFVIDDGHRESSSRAAAGLINPVTGQRLVRAIGTEEHLTMALNTYREMERHLGCTLYTPRPMLRLIRSQRERDALARRRTDPDYAAWLGTDADPALMQSQGLRGQEGFMQQHTGNLHPQRLMEQVRRMLQIQGRYRQQRIDPNTLHFGADKIELLGRQAHHLVFCQGYQDQTNRWFEWLPWQPAKGEILTLRSAGQLPSHIINAGQWLLPLDHGMFKFGSTYDWHNLDGRPTEAARRTLQTQLAALVPTLSESTVVEHRAGVRPGTVDKQPFIGFHPQQPTLGIFNGFGSRGSLMIPWHAALFADRLVGRAALPPTVDIRRHWESN